MSVESSFENCSYVE